MTVNSKKKKRSREAREKRLESHRAYQRETKAKRDADDAGEQVGIVFIADGGMPSYEDFEDRKVTCVGVERAAYLTKSFPLNFKRSKLTAALKEEIAMRDHSGAENKMMTGDGSENKTETINSDGDVVNESGGVEIDSEKEDLSKVIESEVLKLDITVEGDAGSVEDATDEAAEESIDDVTNETESTDDGESTRTSDS